MTEKQADLLPLGSVVEIGGPFPKPFMVYGRKVTDGEGREWDYLLCMYPEGLVRGDDNLGELYRADRADVQKVLFVGYQCEREEEFKAYMEAPDREERTWEVF